VTEKEVSSDKFDKDKCFLAKFWYAWNCKDSFLSAMCSGHSDREYRTETCKTFMRDLLYDLLAVIYPLLRYRVKSLVEAKAAQLKLA
jgi:hypothetical protein